MPECSNTTAVQVGLSDHRIEQRQHSAIAVEYRQLHGQRIGLTDIDTGAGVFIQALAVVIVESSGFDQQPANDSAGSSLPYQLLVQRIHGVRRS